MLKYGLEWHALDSYFQFVEISTPATPESGQIRQYASDSGGISTMCWRNDNGAIICLPTVSTTLVGGTGGAGFVAFWDATSTLTGESQFAYNTTTNSLTITGVAGTPNALNLRSGDAANRTEYSLGRAATDAVFAVAGASGDYSNIVTAAGEVVVRTNTSNLIIAARNASGEIKFTTGAADTLKAVLSSAGDLTIGHTANPNAALVGRGLAVVRNSGFTEATIAEFGAGTITTQFRMIKAGGTASIPTATQSTMGGGFGLSGYGATAFTGARAFMRMVANQNWTDAAQGAYLTLETTNDGSTTLTERFRVGVAGQWGIGGATFGTAGQYFRSGGSAAAPTWATIAASEIGSGAALTRVDDTNVTLTLGGSPSTALLAATSLTLGWSGQLAITRGGTGQSTATTAFNALAPTTTTGDTIYHNGTNNIRLAIGTAGQVLTVSGGVPVWATASGGSFTIGKHIAIPTIAYRI